MSEENLEKEVLNPDDLMAMWETALKESAQSSEKTEDKEEIIPKVKPVKEEPPRPSIPSQPVQLQELKQPTEESIHPELDFILDIPLEIAVEIGRTKMLIKDLLKLNQGSIIELEKFAGEPIEIYVNGKLMAKGEVVVVNDRFGVRITEIISAQDRIRKLGN